MSLRNLSRALAAVGILLAATSARADYVYNYNSFLVAGDYNTATNWSAGVVPFSSGDAVNVNTGIVNSGLTATLVNDASASVPDMLCVGYSPNQQLAGSTGTFNVTDPLALLNIGSVALATSGSANISGPTGLYIGYDGIGAMSISAGTVNVTGIFGLGHDSSRFVGCSPTGTVTQTGGLLTTNTPLYGTDGQYLAGDFNIGDGTTGSSGSYSISGGTLSVGRLANIGGTNGGAGTFTQTGGSVTLGALRMNNSATYTMSGDSAMSCGVSTAGGNIIGGPGSGTSTFNQNGGTVTFTNRLDIGYQSVGVYNINGATATFGTASGAKAMNVGNGLNGNAVGTVNISNGGQWIATSTTGTLTIGGKSDASGVTVTGSGSALTIGGLVSLGNYNWGYLDVTDHATATVGKFYLGGGRTGGNSSLLNVNTGGSMTVSGTASFIGWQGNGNATIDGGTLNVTNALTKTYLGYLNSSVSAGTLTVKGSGVFSGGAGVYLGYHAGCSGVVNVQDTATLTTPVISVGTSGPAVFNQSGGTVNPSADITGNGTYNLSGGVLNANGRNFAVSTFNFSGGTLTNVGTINANINVVALPSGGTATFNQQTTDNPGTVARVLSGSGALTKIGDGPLTLTRVNTYTGLTTVSGGTLQLGDGTNNGSIAGNIVDNATVAFNVAAATTPEYAGLISGTGAVTKLGSGALTLSGANTYTGNTTVDDGVLTISGSSLVKVSNAGLSSQFLGIGGLNLNGPLGLDLSGVTENADTWHIVDVTNLTESYGAGFAVGVYGGASFTQAGSVFSYVDSNRTWTFSELTGDLTLATAATYLQGDADKNDTVNSTDLGLLLSHYNATVSGDGWAWGDFDANGTVNSTDLGLLLSHYNQTSPATSAVPEPSTLLLAAAGLIGLLAYAWRKK